MVCVHYLNDIHQGALQSDCAEILSGTCMHCAGIASCINGQVRISRRPVYAVIRIAIYRSGSTFYGHLVIHVLQVSVTLHCLTN